MAQTLEDYITIKPLLIGLIGYIVPPFFEFAEQVWTWEVPKVLIQFLQIGVFAWAGKGFWLKIWELTQKAAKGFWRKIKRNGD